MNILITSVGRRAYLVKYFKGELKGQGKVHVANSDDKTVAFNYADKSVKTPLIYDDEYVPFLLNYCKENKIDALFSVFDIDLPILAKNKQAFEEIGVKLIVSDSQVVNLCNDKWKTYKFLTENGINTPKTYCTLESIIDAIEKGEVNFPLMVKPRFGCGSIAISVAEDLEELKYEYAKIRKKINKSYLKYEAGEVDCRETVVFQEILQGQEYGADIINDLSGKTRAINIRKKVAMRSGETDIAQIVNDIKIRSCLEKLSKVIKHIGNLDCDVFMVENKPYVLEMNARFGGGYPFCHVAGCNLPKAIVKWLQNSDVDDSILKAKEGVLAFKEIVMTALN